MTQNRNGRGSEGKKMEMVLPEFSIMSGKTGLHRSEKTMNMLLLKGSYR
jgi:hypothetical protein